jgi:putative addiction module component (TIGR02574 family)
MSANIQSLGIDRLSREERRALVQAIWDTIAEEASPALLTPAQGEELNRRLAQDETSPNDVVAWETVKAETLSQLKS